MFILATLSQSPAESAGVLARRTGQHLTPVYRSLPDLFEHDLIEQRLGIGICITRQGEEQLTAWLDELRDERNELTKTITRTLRFKQGVLAA